MDMDNFNQIGHSDMNDGDGECSVIVVVSGHGEK